ncbi:hypothetical protein Tco_0774886 [Tanacetum coccineum]|uniref:Uncharacterized protein n=1 Tax=Tanacetum coccineum TaxID=301880 RepID=A0ABQ4ZPQ9_9ASTR
MSTNDKEKKLWVELKRLFKPDDNDTLWKLQRYMHDLLIWKLYDTCGVHHVSSSRGHDIFMLVEKDYPLPRGLMGITLVNKLQVEEDNEMARNLIMKIFTQANRQRSSSIWKHPLYKVLVNNFEVLKVPENSFEVFKVLENIFESLKVLGSGGCGDDELEDDEDGSEDGEDGDDSYEMLGPAMSPGNVSPLSFSIRLIPGDMSPGKTIPSDKSPRIRRIYRWGKWLML